MTRCAWCNRSDGELRSVTLAEGRQRHVHAVHAAHEAALRDWHGRVVSDTPRFVTTMVIAPAVVFAAVGVAAVVSRALAFVLLGVALIALAAYMWANPYATPQTVRLVGVRRSIALVRLAAVPLALGGVVATIAGLAGRV